MMFAVKTVTPRSSACLSASLTTGTSKARMHAYSGCDRSSCVDARITSILCTGPMLIAQTGICDVLRNSSSASSEPSVEAIA